uniref:Uncharacterized protein n=1 Tax=Knufia peltigerae TaxID=1002370 RepID=A0AA39CUV2_9EURO|nr:hypothetical protein H2204_010532 [Knufia peltigerae]
MHDPALHEACGCQQPLHAGIGLVGRGEKSGARADRCGMQQQRTTDTVPAQRRGDHQHLDEGLTEEVPMLDPVADRRAIELGDVHMAVRQPLADLHGTPWVIGRNAVQGDQCRKIRALGRAYPKCWSLQRQKREQRQRQVEFIATGRSEACMDEGGADTQHAAQQRVATRRAQAEHHLAVTVQQYADGKQVEQQESLDAAGHLEHLPLLPERGIDLMQQQGHHPRMGPQPSHSVDAEFGAAAVADPYTASVPAPVAVLGAGGDRLLLHQPHVMTDADAAVLLLLFIGFADQTLAIAITVTVTPGPTASSTLFGDEFGATAVGDPQHAAALSPVVIFHASRHRQLPGQSRASFERALLGLVEVSCAAMTRCRNPGPRPWLRPAAGQAQNRPGAVAGEGSLKPRVGNGTQEWRTCGALRRPGPALAQDGFISVRQRMQGVTSRIIPGTSDCIGLQFFTRSSAFERDLRASPVAAGAGADKDGVALISSIVIHRSAGTGAVEVQVLDTTFKGKRVFVAWGLRGLELTREAEPEDTVAARRALRLVSRQVDGPRSSEIFIANQSGVAISVYRMLTEARSGDAVFFLCDSPPVVEWLVTSLEVQPEPTA